MNEAQSPKISYDYQAALGEFGQIRESYQRLKSVHSFCRTFAETFCHMQTVVPEGASQNETVVLHMTGEDITFSGISLAPEENCILPFHMDLNGIDLVTATAQPLPFFPIKKSRSLYS